ncbi:MAG: hypothetical protein M1819_000253 [Sarea resinae]|nr:MAG: hypothetical protein M1819_000253 [Sarea resinae]
MAPSSGHQMVPMALRMMRHALKRTSTFVRAKVAAAGRPLDAQLQPILARNTPRHPIHPAAYLRQSKGRWYTTHSTINAAVRRFTSSAGSGAKYSKSSFPKSTIGSAVNRLPHRAPFASTLRPNLTGGTLSRTAGGYSNGAGRMGGARYFSHTPAAPAEVINNVSAAVRAFWLSGQKAQFDGVHPRSGEKNFKAVSDLQDVTGRKMRSLPRATPGSYIDFHVNPTITALSPLNGLQNFEAPKSDKQTLNKEGLLDILSIDFSRALKDLSAVLNDLKRLSALGDLPLSLPEMSTLRVHFPGCDAETVERLCDEAGVQRGIVSQDEGFDESAGAEMALLFPFAPDSSTTTSSNASLREAAAMFTKPQQAKRDEVDWKSMLSAAPTLTSPRFSTRSNNSGALSYEDIGMPDEDNPWISSPSDYASLHSADIEEDCDMYFEQPARSLPRPPQSSSSQYEGFEGIYRFLEQCDDARR